MILDYKYCKLNSYFYLFHILPPGLEPGRVDIINSTLGKALGGAAGGYTSGSQHLIDLLRQRARPYLFSNSIPPAVVACADQVGTEKKECEL